VTDAGRTRGSARLLGSGLVLTLTLVALPGCAASADSAAPATTGSEQESQRFPDVIGVAVSADPDGTYTFAVTMTSPYDSPDRYADGWRIVGPDGETLGEMTLGHDHAAEQPFTRTQTGVEIPGDVTTVTVEGRDTENGYGGTTRTVQIPAA
jgi:hypothetical protein